MNLTFQNKITGFRSIFIAILVLGILSALFGCKPPPEPQQKPAMVRKKIPAGAKPAAKTPLAITAEKETGSKASKPASEPAAVQEKDKGDKKAGEKKSEKPLAATKSVPGAKLAAEDQFAELYSSEGKADPFAPFIKTKAERERDREKSINRRIPRTPLEKVDISQVKLTAIIQSPTGNFGLVEESTGKGYVVTAGTYIGVNGGKIKQILNDRLIVEEEAENVFGKITIREIEVKLHKPAGEF